MGDKPGQDRMDETGDVYVAEGMYDAEDDTNGIRVGASPTHEAASRRSSRVAHGTPFSDVMNWT